MDMKIGLTVWLGFGLLAWILYIGVMLLRREITIRDVVGDVSNLFFLPFLLISLAGGPLLFLFAIYVVWPDKGSN